MKHKGIYYVYILANKKQGILYTGVTNDLIKRIYQHKNNLIKGFTEKYQIHLLVHYETYNDIRDAITKEKRIKKWNRQWKINLIEETNKEWVDLYDQLNPI